MWENERKKDNEGVSECFVCSKPHSDITCGNCLVSVDSRVQPHCSTFRRGVQSQSHPAACKVVVGHETVTQKRDFTDSDAQLSLTKTTTTMPYSTTSSSSTTITPSNARLGGDPAGGQHPPPASSSRIPVTPAVLRSIFASSRTILEERSLSRVAFFRQAPTYTHHARNKPLLADLH